MNLEKHCARESTNLQGWQTNITSLYHPDLGDELGKALPWGCTPTSTC
jgi:hypothetical protein